MAQPLETVLGLYFTEAEKDVWEEIAPDLLSFSFTDSETNTADSLSITLKDETGKWAQRWNPDPGERVKAYIKQKVNGKISGTLNCGKFFVDTMKVQGAPRIFEMGAVSVPLNKPIRKRSRKDAFWEFQADCLACSRASFGSPKESNPIGWRTLNPFILR